MNKIFLFLCWSLLTLCKSTQAQFGDYGPDIDFGISLRRRSLGMPKQPEGGYWSWPLPLPPTPFPKLRKRSPEELNIRVFRQGRLRKTQPGYDVNKLSRFFIFCDFHFFC